MSEQRVWTDVTDMNGIHPKVGDILETDPGYIRVVVWRGDEIGWDLATTQGIFGNAADSPEAWRQFVTDTSNEHSRYAYVKDFAPWECFDAGRIIGTVWDADMETHLWD